MRADAIPEPDLEPLTAELPEAAARARPRRRAADLGTTVQRLFFATCAVVALAGALAVALVSDADLAVRLGSATMFAVVGLLALGGLAVPRRHAAAAMAGLLALAVLAIAGQAAATGWGLRAPGVAFYGMFVCTLCVAASVRFGQLLALLAAAAVMGVGLGVPDTQTQPHSGPPLELLLVGQLLLVAAGLASGWMLSRVQYRFVSRADDREQRFGRLLALAADAYWEIDVQGRLVAMERQHGAPPPPGALPLGEVPWEQPRFGCDAETLDTLLADIESREPFRDLVVTWQIDEGVVRHFMVSGEPRFDERGVFRGYWGVARDISADLAAQRALTATETRYQELFSRIPTPLVLHRGGRVVDANPAALALFGQDDLSSLAGADLLQAYAGGDSRERARRAFEALETQPPGASDAVTDYRLEAHDGRRLAVRANSVRVETEGGAATLSIYIDDTERRAAEEAVRRSEAMLSHLVATSPDIITLTDLASGRYAMVNRTFERVTGYTAAEVVGHSSLDLGVWADPEDRSRFVGRLREHGSVQDLPTRFMTKDGRLVSMLVSGARFTMDRREYLVINARDVTQAERDRLEREAILEHASVGVAVTRAQRFVLANPAFEQMFGWPRGRMVGQGGAVVWASDAEYAEVGATYGQRLAAGELVEFERMMRRLDGSSFLGRVIGKAIDPSHPAHGGTVWLIEDVTQRRQFEQQLARARDEAEAASRAKSAFLANVSHELRTPLNGIIGLAQLARDTGIDEERRRQYLDQVLESTRSLADIISDILDLQKIEAGKLRLEVAKFDLGALLRSLQRLYGTLADGRDLRLVFDTAAGVEGLAVGDELRVRQIVGNFLSNAVKFTGRGEVRVVTRRIDPSRVRFEVRDTGPGIPVEVQPELFKPFSQADVSMTRRFGGTGLGLSICRELATLMGGTVGLESEFGHGSLFWAELPLPEVRGETLSAPPAPLPDGGELRGTRVLLAEDNPVNALIAVALLERWGVTVGKAGDGAEAVQMAVRAAGEGQPFDAILMDIQMPVMSGYEATRRLREEPATARVPIIALTAAALVSERQQALDAGMDDFLTKPIDADRLRVTLQRWIAERRAA